jgi:HAD superfamily hydrolase (TIGR01509 family)
LTDIHALDAVIFDVDGTLADTERDGHRVAFNAAFASHGVDVTWDPNEYGRLLKITGGRHRIAADLRARGFGEAADQLAVDVHRTKTALVRDRVLAGGIVARAGVADLVSGLHATGVRVAVATTGRRAWVEPLVRHLLGDGIVEVMVTGDDVSRLKPHPEVYQLALRELEVPPEATLAVEDSEVGLQAALGAGLATVLITNRYTADQDFSGAAAVLPAFDGPARLTAELCRWLHHRYWVGLG